MHADLGDHARACELATSALSLAREIGDRRAQADALNALGRAAAGLGGHEQAASQYAAALDLARETGARYQEAEALIGLYAIHTKNGAADSAAACAAGALAIAEATGDRRLRGRVQALTSGNPDRVPAAAKAPGSPDALGEPARITSPPA